MMDESGESFELRDQTGTRRALTMRNNLTRQVTVNFMPSRQSGTNTLRLRRSNPEHNALLDDVPDSASSSEEQQANIIVREMEQHMQLMEDNPEAEDMRREALRDLPQGLTMKRHVRAKLSASVSHRSRRKPLSLWKRMKYRISFANKRFRDRLRDLLFSIDLWYESIRKIEGHLGSAVGSYFYFLRWLFAFNVVMCVLVVCFVVVPQEIHNRTVKTAEGFTDVVDFVTGEGMFADTLLFYGHYHFDNIASFGPPYNMAFAYFFTMTLVYLLFFAILCYRTGDSYRRTFIGTRGGHRHVFASKVFGGWDFGIATDSGAMLNARGLYNDLKELLAEQNKKNIAIPLSVKIWQYTTNTVVTVLVIGTIAALHYGLWMLLSMEMEVSYWSVAVSAIITAVVCVCPLVFDAVVKVEYYSARTGLYVTLCRTFLLHVGTVFVLLFFWTRSGRDCWETSFGQEAYRLVLLEAVISLIVLPMFEFILGFAYRLHPTESRPSFNIAYSSLSLIYNQVVLWFGMLFSPLLVVAVTFKFLLLFYVKKTVAMKACVPDVKVWRAAQTQTVMYMLVTLAQFITIFGVGSLFFRMQSTTCGPFRAYPHVFAVLTEGALALGRHHGLRAALLFLVRPGVMAFLMIGLCVAVYYMRARSLAQRSMVGILRQMLVIQAKDKDFLLSAIAKVSNGEWLYSPKEGNASSPNSHTWKYLNDDNVRKPSNAGFAFDSSRLNHSVAESSRPRSYAAKESRPSSYFKDGSKSFNKEDGDTDSSFSWQGSNSYLNDASRKKGKEWL